MLRRKIKALQLVDQHPPTVSGAVQRTAQAVMVTAASHSRPGCCVAMLWGFSIACYMVIPQGPRHHRA